MENNRGLRQARAEEDVEISLAFFFFLFSSLSFFLRGLVLLCLFLCGLIFHRIIFALILDAVQRRFEAEFSSNSMRCTMSVLLAIECVVWMLRKHTPIDVAGTPFGE